MDVEHLSDVYNLIQSTGGTGAQIVTANAVGGGSNLYLAASIRSPRETFERRDHHPDDGPDRRMWPKAIARKEMDNWYRRVERALRVRQPSWKEVSKSGGLWAATLDAAGHTCDRVPLAIDFGRCVDAKWCHTGCIFGAKNTVNTNYLASAERAGVRVRPNRQAEQRPPLAGQRRRLPLRGHGVGDGQRGPEPLPPAAGQRGDRVQGADPRRGRDGHAADPDALAERPAHPLRARGPAPGRERRSRGRAGVQPAQDQAAARHPALRAVPQGQADHHDDLRLLGRQALQPPRRDPVHAPGDLPLEPHQLPLRRRPLARGRARRGGARRRSARSRSGRTGSSCWRWWRTRWTGGSTSCRPRAVACGPTPARWWSGTFSYSCPSSRSRCASWRTARWRRSASDAAWRSSSSSPRPGAPTRRTRSAAPGWRTRPTWAW